MLARFKFDSSSYRSFAAHTDIWRFLMQSIAALNNKHPYILKRMSFFKNTNIQRFTIIALMK